MNRGVLGIGVAMIFGLLLAILVAWAADYIDPPPISVDMNHALGATAPMKILATLIKLFGWGGATALAANMAVRSTGEPGWPAWLTGVVMGAGVVLLHVLWPHPIWFLVLRLLVVGAMAFLAGRGWRLARA
jgi:hypothetical protein